MAKPPAADPNSVSPVAKRDVDLAMAADRPPKITMRNLWADQVESFLQKHDGADFPIFATLSGAEGRDIRSLIDRGLIELTETGGIAESDMGKIVAIEHYSPAVLQLSKLFVSGLRIREVNFSSLVRGESPFSFPDNDEDRAVCCSSVLNLDFEESLKIRLEGEELVFPLFVWIEKLSQIHRHKRPGVDWCLCLTINATINQPNLLGPYLQSFLNENFDASAEFDESCRDLLGQELYEAIRSDAPLDLSDVGFGTAQKLLMIFVPKKIARMTHTHGWKLSTLKNLAYDGEAGHAPMVTWILYFSPDARAAAQPQTVYRESLGEILASAGNIDADGQIYKFE